MWASPVRETPEHTLKNRSIRKPNTQELGPVEEEKGLRGRKEGSGENGHFSEKMMYVHSFQGLSFFPFFFFGGLSTVTLLIRKYLLTFTEGDTMASMINEQAEALKENNASPWRYVEEKSPKSKIMNSF